MMARRRLVACVLPCLLALGLAGLTGGCASPKGDTVAEQRAAARAMRDETLRRAYEGRPWLKDEVARAHGYAVFSNWNVNVIFAGVGNGYGVARENSSGDEWFMDMYQGGVGLGAGVKDYRAILVFPAKEGFDWFLENGWDFGGAADAAAKAGEKGGAITGDGLVGGARVYTLTESGLALQATLTGVKFQPNARLNR